MCLNPRMLILSKAPLVETLPNWLPCCAAMHQCAQMSVPASPHDNCSNQKLGTRAAQCVAKKLVTGPFPSLVNDQLKVSKSGKWLVGEMMIVTDLLQNGAEDGMFGPPTRDALVSAAIIQWFMYNNTNLPRGHLVWTACQDCQSQEWPLKSRALRHGHMDNALSILDRVRSVPPAAVSFLVKFFCAISRACGKNVRSRAVFPCITFCEGLVPDAEPTFLRFANVEIPNSHHKTLKITRQCDGAFRESSARSNRASKCTLMTTRRASPDCIVTIWSCPGQVISCVTTA